MENKKLDVKALEELGKTADSYRAFFANLAYEISKALADIKAHKQEDTWEMKCPYEKRDEYWALDSHGNIFLLTWDGYDVEECRLNQGNTFPSKEAAELEAKRRNMLTRFKAFRDECNDGWEPDTTDVTRKKYYLSYSKMKKGVYVSYNVLGNHLHIFGYFKNEKDAERAIELFGDEIEALFVDCEED